jgi:hypothetical protein
MQATMENREVVSEQPLDPEDVAAFLDGTLEGDKLEQVEARLADDSAARQELIRVSRTISSAPQPRRRDHTRLGFLATLAAAAAIAVVVIRPVDIQGPATSAAIERTVGEGTADVVDIIAPVDNADLAASAKPFVWHSIDQATYRVVVSDSLGQTVYEGNTSDTAISIPIQLKEGARYYWSVDALVADGSSAASGAHEFVARKR